MYSLGLDPITRSCVLPTHRPALPSCSRLPSLAAPSILGAGHLPWQPRQPSTVKPAGDYLASDCAENATSKTSEDVGQRSNRLRQASVLNTDSNRRPSGYQPSWQYRVIRRSTAIDAAVDRPPAGLGRMPRHPAGTVPVIPAVRRYLRTWGWLAAHGGSLNQTAVTALKSARRFSYCSPQDGDG